MFGSLRVKGLSFSEFSAKLQYRRSNSEILGFLVSKDMLQSDEHFVNYCRYALALGRGPKHVSFYSSTCLLQQQDRPDCLV